MKPSLTVNHVESEFHIQATLFSELRARGIDARGEVRCRLDGDPMRFDLMVFDGLKPVYVIEVKPKRGKNWRRMWDSTPQGRRYHRVPLPVFMVCGIHQATDFLNSDPSAFAGREGVIWREEWARRQQPNR